MPSAHGDQRLSGVTSRETDHDGIRDASEKTVGQPLTLTLRHHAPLLHGELTRSKLVPDEGGGKEVLSHVTLRKRCKFPEIFVLVSVPELRLQPSPSLEASGETPEAHA